MLLYHFTAANRLDHILAEGLSLGDVAVSGGHAPGENAVWLTSSKSGDEHGLGEPRELTDDEREHMKRWKGVALARGARWDDKREVRITVRLGLNDRALRRFLPWARRRFDPQWLDTLIRSGGGKRCADTWWLYFGVIAPTAFVEVALRDERGDYRGMVPPA